jgi:hypothetical protein
LKIAFSTNRLPEPKSQLNGACPLMRSPCDRFTFMALRVRSRIIARPLRSAKGLRPEPGI